MCLDERGESLSYKYEIILLACAKWAVGSRVGDGCGGDDGGGGGGEGGDVRGGGGGEMGEVEGKYK